MKPSPWITLGLTGLASLAVLGTFGCGRTNAPLPTAIRGSALQSLKADALFPTDPGRVWRYEVVAHPQDDPETDVLGTQTVTVDRVRRQGTRTEVTLRDIDTFTQAYRFPVVTFDGDKLVIAGVTYWGAAAEQADDLANEFLHLPWVPAEHWDDGNWAGKVVGRETVTVPAGTFDAWRVEGIGTYEQEYTVVGDYWFAPGVGIVKSSLTVPGWYLDHALIPAGRRVAVDRSGRLPGHHRAP